VPDNWLTQQAPLHRSASSGDVDVLDALHDEITALVDEIAPELTQAVGMGRDVAA
jgi:hypothetical protein